MHIKGELIISLEDQLSTFEAWRELIENSIDAGATQITGTLTPRSMTFTDNGEGLKTMNDITTPGKSSSRTKPKPGVIGSKGIGGCQAMATFGRHWDIRSVRRTGRTLKYCRHIVQWDVKGELPKDHDGSTLQITQATSEIRKGGTQIVVTQRQPGHGEIRGETLVRELEKTYRPALAAGLSITVEMPTENFRRKVSDASTKLNKFTAVLEELAGSIRVEGNRDLGFTIRYAVLKEFDKILSGCHVIFGPRVVHTRTAVGALTLSPTVFIDVILHSEWKMLLSSNKSRVSYTSQLYAELFKLLSEWIKEQKEEAQTFRIKLMNGKIAGQVNDRIAWLLRDQPGIYGPPPSKRREANPDPTSRHEPDPNRVIAPRRTRAVENSGQFGAEFEQQKGCLRFDLDVSRNLGTQLYRISYDGPACKVTFNIGEHQRTIENLYNTEGFGAVYNLALVAFGIAVGAKAKAFSALLTALRKFTGYDIDEDSDPADIAQQVSNFLIDDTYEGPKPTAAHSRKEESATIEEAA